MTYQEEDKAKLKREKEREAIRLAMGGQWREAIDVNTVILQLFPSDVDALNRLGRIYMELGEYEKAREAYSRTLEVDHYNTIAKKNLARLAHLGARQTAPPAEQHKVAPQLFVVEAGKARVVSLVHLAPREVLATVAAGEPVSLVVEGQRLMVKNGQGEYLGGVEPKHGARLLRLIAGGNRYIAAIASVGENEVKVLIREIYQHPSQAGRLSFPPQAMEGFRPYTRESILNHGGGEGEERMSEVEEEGVLPEEPEEAESYEMVATPPEGEEETESSEE